ncbi:hypothetical protein EC973_005674 [Apophysomyces ossiformis]|uniref:C2H2-type domain-containing protein n=1 Tax=Apophysomyces ossiformis TaxID=679940 RepID=A0A8H7BJ20_9FUNG|nr:hypothetical protein EC973_005674 [Apophysomyces ossiformis]
MSERRAYSPAGRGGIAFGDWSDDDFAPRSHGREKFRRERSVERDRGAYGDTYNPNAEEYDRYERKKRSRRAETPPEERRHKRHASFASPPHSSRPYGASRGPRGSRERDSRESDYHHQEGDHYIPNYERDGYVPGPRYSSIPEPPNGGSAFGYPVMDVMNPQLVGGRWPSIGRIPPIDPNQFDFLMPYKQFCEYLRQTYPRSQFDDSELQSRYGKYKAKYAARQLSLFFNSNKDKQWFQEKYHPTVSLPRIQEMKQRRRKYQKEFLIALEEGKYDDIRYDEQVSPDQATSNDHKEDGEVEKDNENETEVQNDDNLEYEPHLIIKTVPPTIPRQRIIEMCQEVEGFEYLALSEPSPNKKFHRIGWIRFKEGTDIQKAFDQLQNLKIDDFIFHLAMNRKNQIQSRATKTAPEIANTTERLKADLQNALELSKEMDSDLGDDIKGAQSVISRAEHVISEHSKDTAPEENEGDRSDEGDSNNSSENYRLKKKLDLLLLYLRSVHMYCYYCGMETDSLEELNRRCVDPHCRKEVGSSASNTSDNKQAAKNDKSGRDRSEVSKIFTPFFSAAQWVKNLDQRIAMKIDKPDGRKLEKMGGRSLESETDAFVQEHVLKEHEAKYKCKVGECAKAFKGFDFVEKHILTKHREEITRLSEEIEFYNNYVRDPNHLLPVSPTSHMNVPMGMAGSAIGGNVGFGGAPSPFMLPGMSNGMRPPPGLPVQAAAVGTPWDQIPRIGFGDVSWANTSGSSRRDPYKGSAGGARRDTSMDIDELMPRDPRQVKSYVDLDAPAEGDADVSFY